MEEIAKLAFPNEEVNMNDFNDWAKENSDEAYKLALLVIAEQKLKIKWLNDRIDHLKIENANKHPF